MVANFRVFCRVHLDERSARERRHSARNLGLTDASRTNHHDVLRSNFVAHRFVDALTTPAIANCDGNSAFGAFLTDNMLVKLFDDFLGSKLTHASSSTMMLELV